MRQISLMDIFAKIAEGFVAKWVVQDIKNNIDVNQFGNVQGVSTSHYLMSLLHHLHQGSDKSYNIGTVFLTDFSQGIRPGQSQTIEKLSALGVWGLSFHGCSFLKGTNGRQKTYEVFHVYSIFYSGFMCQTTVIFGITKDESLVLNTLASWNCFTCRNLF